MPNKKGSEKPEQSSADEALEKRVEAMMDPTKPDPAPAGPAAADAPTTATAPPIDIFKDLPQAARPGGATTAPELPSAHIKKVSVADGPLSKPVKPTEPAQPVEKPAAQLQQTEPKSEDDAAEPLSDSFDDTNTDKAVIDIIAKESDALLAAEDVTATPVSKPSGPAKNSGTGGKAKLGRLLKNKRTWVVVVLLLVLLLGLPFTRYKLLGLVIKKSVTVSVLDSITSTPVSNAQVKFGHASAKTNANGKAVLRAGPGSGKLMVEKQYYKQASETLFVSLKANPEVKTRLVATGRQVPVSVVNKITGKPVAGAEVKVLDTTARTDTQGKATIVLPATAVSDSATISSKGYNKANANIKVTSSLVSENTLAITPAGHVYFLSNLSGNIDVMKANLDGSGRQTVLAGTGKEDPRTTSLLATRDWHYVVLKARRDSAQAALYLIDTSSDKVTQFDSGDADFALVGWYNHSFVYDITRNNVPQSQSGHEVLKSYNAELGELAQLDQNQTDGSPATYAYQGFNNFYIVNGLVVYNTQWYTYDSAGAGIDLGPKTGSIRAVQPTGQGKKDYQTYSASGLGYVQAALYEPQGIYYAVYNYNDNKTIYYKFEDHSVSPASDLTRSDFNKSYPTYLVSPSGNQVFWSELRDGKNSLFTADASAQKKKQIASLSDYSNYGWYSDNYLLVSKNNSQLYIMPASGVAAGHQPLKVTDYYKPAQTYTGYGYGYGGL